MLLLSDNINCIDLLRKGAIFSNYQTKKTWKSKQTRCWPLICVYSLWTILINKKPMLCKINFKYFQLTWYLIDRDVLQHCSWKTESHLLWLVYTLRTTCIKIQSYIQSIFYKSKWYKVDCIKILVLLSV